LIVIGLRRRLPRGAGREPMRKRIYSIRRALPLLGAAGALACLGLIGSANYLLFHTLAEGFCVLVACGIFVIAWNDREQIKSGYLGLPGPAYLFVGCLELLHALAYKLPSGGMGVFPGIGSNPATQLWIAARAMAKDLDPVGLSGGGFLAALADLAGNARQAYGIDCDFDCPHELDIQDEIVATHLFYIAEEAILRAWKIGKARKMHIILANEGEGATLLVRDDGQGPPPEKPADASGAGTGTMRYRASAIHGTLSMETCPGGGNTICCHVPGLDPWKGRRPTDDEQDQD
jgi:hypothetical protein